MLITPATFKYLFILDELMEEESIFLNSMGDSPQMRIMQYMIEGRNFDYTLTDMLNAGVSWGTLNNLIPKLVRFGIISKTRKIGRATLYKINENNLVSKKLIELYDQLIMRKLDDLEAEEIVAVRSLSADT